MDSGSNSKAAVPFSHAAERATIRTHLVLLPSFAYDMCDAYCCCLYCVVELNAVFSYEYIDPVIMRLLGTRLQVSYNTDCSAAAAAKQHFCMEPRGQQYVYHAQFFVAL